MQETETKLADLEKLIRKNQKQLGSYLVSLNNYVVFKYSYIESGLAFFNQLPLIKPG